MFFVLSCVPSFFSVFSLPVIEMWRDLGFWAYCDNAIRFIWDHLTEAQFSSSRQNCGMVCEKSCSRAHWVLCPLITAMPLWEPWNPVSCRPRKGMATLTASAHRTWHCCDTAIQLTSAYLWLVRWSCCVRCSCFMKIKNIKDIPVNVLCKSTDCEPNMAKWVLITVSGNILS